MNPADVSIVVPVLNEAKNLQRLLPRCQAYGGCQIVVADGGSGDGSAEMAQCLGADVVSATGGRGPQLRAGAAAATRPVLWFVHADTVLPCQPFAAMAVVVARGNAGAFQLRIDHPAWKYRLIELGAQLRTWATGIPYGDQALFLSRDLYAAAGGFPAYPLMEDVALGQAIRRLGARIDIVDMAVASSARRWERDGATKRTLHNWSLALRYRALGVHPSRLADEYRPERISVNHEQID